MPDPPKTKIRRITPVKAFDQLFKLVILTILVFTATGVFSFYDAEPYPWMIILFLGHLAIILCLFRESTLIKFMVVYIHGLMTITGIILWIFIGTSSTGTWLSQWWTSTQVFVFCIAIGFVGPSLEHIKPVLGVIWLIIEMWTLVYIWWFMEISNQRLVTHMVDPCLIRLQIFHIYGIGYFARYIFVFNAIVMASEITWNMGFYGKLVYIAVTALGFVITQVLGMATFTYSLFMPLFGFPCKWFLKEIFVNGYKDVLIFMCVVVFCGGLVEYMLQSIGIFRDFLPPESIFTHVFQDIFFDSTISMKSTHCVNGTCSNESTVLKTLQFVWNTFDSVTSWIVSKDSVLVKMSKESHGILDWMFGWIYHLSSCTQVIWNIALDVIRLFFHVGITNWKNIQFFMGVLYPVCVILLIENFTDIPAALNAIMELSKKPKEEEEEDDA